MLVLLLLTALGMLVQGYHPGAEDDGVYLSAIKKDLNPTLYPHDSDFFMLQLQATVFDKVVAGSVRLTHLPLGIALLGWQFISTFLLLWGCWRISRRCFVEVHAQWAAVATVAALLTLPVSGAALYLSDQYLHPRTLATAIVLAAVVAILDKKSILAAFLLAGAFLVHPLMAAFGTSYCVLLAWKQSPRSTMSMALMALPMGWIFEPTSPAWQQAAHTRDYYYLSRWQWYEWLGVFAPLILLWWFRRIGRNDDSTVLARMSSRLVLYGCVQFAVALVILLVPGLDRLRPFQPMRYLHLLYLLFVLFAGGLIGQRILRGHVLRWLLFFLPLSLGMFIGQRQTFPATEHMEWPGHSSRNAWLQAFTWVRQNTPTDAMFALDPYYMQRPGEDFHSFRALAERSAMADYVKDPSVSTQVPRLAVRWQKEVEAQQGWPHFQAQDFQRLKAGFGVDWVVLERPGVAGLSCPYENDTLLVCRIE
ncbi:MAG: DUF6798 domain-containing protein [Terriglobales bacterium]